MATVAAFSDEVAALGSRRLEERIHFYEQIQARLRSKTLVDELAANSAEFRSRFWTNSLQFVLQTAQEDFNQLKKVCDQKGPQHAIVVRKKKTILEVLRRMFVGSRSAGCTKNTEIVSYMVTVLSDSSLRIMIGLEYASFLDSQVFTSKEFVSCLPDTLLESLHRSLASKLKAKFCSHYLALFSQLVLVASERKCLFVDVSVVAKWLVAAIQDKDEKLFQRLVNSVDCLIQQEYFNVYFTKISAFALSVLQCYQQFFSSFATATHEVACSFLYHFYSSLSAHRGMLERSSMSAVQALLLKQETLRESLVSLRSEKFVNGVRFHRADKANDFPVFYRLLALLLASEQVQPSVVDTEPMRDDRGKRQKCISAFDQTCENMELAAMDDFTIILDIKLIRSFFETKNVTDTNIKRLSTTLNQVQNFHKDGVIVSFLMNLVTDCLVKWKVQFSNEFLQSYWILAFSVLSRKNIRQTSFLLLQALTLAWSRCADSAIVSWLLFAYEVTLSVRPISVQLGEFAHAVDVCTSIVNQHTDGSNRIDSRCYCSSDRTLLQIAQVFESLLPDYKPSSFNDFVDLVFSAAVLLRCHFITNAQSVAQVFSTLCTTAQSLRDKCDLYHFADQFGIFAKTVGVAANPHIGQPIQQLFCEAREFFYSILTGKKEDERDATLLNLEDEVKFSPSGDDTLSATYFTSTDSESTVNRQERLRHSLLRANLRLALDLCYSSEEQIHCIKALAQVNSELRIGNPDLTTLILLLIQEFIKFSTANTFTHQYIMLAFDLFRSGIRSFRKNQQALVHFCDAFKLFVEKLGTSSAACDSQPNTYFNYCQELLVVIMLSQESVACCTRLISSWTECVAHLCHLRPRLASRDFKNKSCLSLLLEQLGHYSESVSTKVVNALRSMDWNDAAQVDRIVGVVRALFEVEVVAEDGEFLIDLKRSRVCLTENVMTAVLQCSNSSRYGLNLLILIQMHEGGLLDSKYVKHVIASAGASRDGYADKLYLTVCLAEWLKQRTLLQFPVALFNYSSVQHFVSECMELCVSAAIESAMDVQQISSVIKLPVDHILRSCHLSAFAPAISRSFFSGNSELLGRLKSLLHFSDTELESRELGRYLMTACCFIPSDQPFSADVVAELIKHCCFALSNQRSGNPLKPFVADGSSASNFVVNFCCAAVEFWSTSDQFLKAVSLLSSCTIANFLVQNLADAPQIYAAYDISHLLNVILMALEHIVDLANFSTTPTGAFCLDVTLSTLKTLLENCFHQKSLDFVLPVADNVTKLRPKIRCASNLETLSTILKLLLGLNDINLRVIRSELDLDKLTADNACHSTLSSLHDGVGDSARFASVVNTVFASYSSISLSSQLKMSSSAALLTALEQKLMTIETVEQHETVVRIAHAFKQLPANGLNRNYQKFDINSFTSLNTLSSKLIYRDNVEHKHPLYPQYLSIIRFLINTTFSGRHSEKEAAIVCLRKILPTSSASATVQHTPNFEMKEICRTIASLGQLCQEERVLRCGLWANGEASFDEVIQALTNYRSSFVFWIQEVIKAIYRSRKLADPFVLELRYLVESSAKFCEVIFSCVLFELLLQASSDELLRISSVLGELLVQCQCHERLSTLVSFLLQLHAAEEFQLLHRTKSSLPSIEVPWLEASAAALKLNDAFSANLFIERHYSTVLVTSPNMEPLLLEIIGHMANEDAVIGCQRLLSDYRKPLQLKNEILGRQLLDVAAVQNDILSCCLRDLSFWRLPETKGQNIPEALQSEELKSYSCSRTTEGDFWSQLSLANQYLLAGQLASASHLLKALDDRFGDFSLAYVDSNKGLFDFVEKRIGLRCLQRVLSASDDKTVLRPVASSFLAYAEKKANNFQFCRHYKTLAVHWNLHKAIIARSPPKTDELLKFIQHCVSIKDVFVSLNYQDKALSFISSLSECIVGLRVPDFVSHIVTFEEAALYWVNGEKDVALLLGRRCLNALESLAVDQQAFNAYLNVVQRYSRWLNESKCESADSILEDYLLSAERKLSDSTSANPQLFYAIAEFSDAQYMSLESYTKSQEFQMWRSVTIQSKENAIQLAAAGEKSRFSTHLNKQSQLDNARINDIEMRKVNYLTYTLSNLGKCLTLGDEFDKSVYRFVDLWLSNKTDPKITSLVANTLDVVRLDKFIPLFPQLSARLSKQQSAEVFQKKLTEFLSRVTGLHPYHTLYNLFALVHANLDSTYIAKSEQPLRLGQPPTSPVLDRSLAAEAIIHSVTKQDRSLANIAKSIMQLCRTYIELANAPLSQGKDGKPVSGSLKSLGTVKQLTAIRDAAVLHVPTLRLAVDQRGKYSNVVYPLEFLDEFTTAGGINLPKIIQVRCSDGIIRRQLIKGNDDMRQDAVMQQVFRAVNQLLSDNPAAAQRQLFLSTYQVVPMSQRSGILEWCEGTSPLGTYLATGSTSAHARYRPTDLQPVAARELMRKCSTASVSERIKCFRDICSKLPPVFRHFFFERFAEPREFYLRRLTYTRSVAAWSMVGYILGLGDRHVHNILVHNETANLFHIDLGIAFDQGKLLPTPETVPFRLTRDIVDGMGILGVEGDFRRACEITLSLLRSSNDVILTICSILLHDPLYHWTLSPERAHALQLKSARSRVREPQEQPQQLPSGDSAGTDCGGQRSLMAQRVMLRLQERLMGREANSLLNVEGQVSYLIKQATDARNLALIFYGWQPYL